LNSSGQIPSDGIYRLVLGAGETTKLKLDFILPQSQMLLAGQYDLNYRVQISDFSNNDLAETIDGLVSVSADSRAQINIAGTAGFFGDNQFTDMVYFEDPSVGDKRRLFIQARSNNTSTMTISSQNGSKMLHEDQNGSAVKYDVMVDGIHTDISSPVVLNTLQATGLGGVNIPFDIEISELVLPFAGEYRDIVTISITTD